MNVVDVENLVTCVGRDRIVDGVSFSLRAGEVTALVGESGSGKTTTGLALLGEWPDAAEVSGRIEVAGAHVDPEHAPPPGTVGYIPQQPSAALNPVRRVGPVLDEMARRHVDADSRGQRRHRARERTLEALRRAQLPDGEKLLRRYPHELSGGQQQRIVLAQALVCHPEVVVADEPTTGQDVLTRGQIVEELRSLAEQGVAVLLLSHDLDLVRALAHHVLVMRSGKIVESGRTAEVFGAPRHEYTRQLIDSQTGLGAPPHSAEPDQGEALLSVRDLVAGHRGPRGRVETVRNVSMHVRPGEKVAVVGRSGSGKTTLARCIAGLHPGRSGDVLLDGTAVASRLRRRSRDELARIQYVFQDSRASFNEFVPVLDQAARTAQRLRDAQPDHAQANAIEMFERVGLPERTARRLPTSLSGGELQRAALVRALLAEPELLICDEITSGLDTVNQAGILDLLDDLQRGTGCALIVITHDLGVVAGLADRVAVMDQGRIVEQGTAAEVLKTPQHDLTRALVAAAAGEIVSVED